MLSDVPGRGFSMNTAVSRDTSVSGRLGDDGPPDASHGQGSPSVSWGARPAVQSSAFRDRGGLSVALSEAELLSIERTFRTFDEDGSNSIDKDELKTALGALGHALTDTQIDELFDQVDVDGSGSLTLDEFVQLLMLWKEASQYKMLEGGGATIQQIRIEGALDTKLWLHDSFPRLVWDGVVYAVVFYVWALTLFFVTRNRSEIGRFNRVFLGPDVVASLLLAADILVNFMSTTLARGRLLDDYVSVARAYATRWLLFDLIAILPFNQMGLSDALFTLNLLRLLKAVKLPWLFARSGRRHVTPTYLGMTLNIIPLFQRLYAFLLMVHSLAVAWSVLKQYDPYAALDPLDATLTGDESRDWTTAVYFVLSTFTTTGYGDVDVVGPLQRGVASMLSLFGIVLQGIVIGLVVDSIQQTDIYTDRGNKLREALAVCSYFEIPRSLLNEILQFQNHVLEHNLSTSYNDLLQGLPVDMCANIGLFIRVNLITSVPFFAAAHQGTKVSIAQCLRPVIFLPEQYVFLVGEVGDGMYFISYGFLDVFSNLGSRIAVLKSADFFGEAALLSDHGLRGASIKAITYCDLFFLDKADFEETLRRFPRFRQTVLDAAAVQRTKNQLSGALPSHSSPADSPTDSSSHPHANPLAPLMRRPTVDIGNISTAPQQLLCTPQSCSDLLTAMEAGLSTIDAALQRQAAAIQQPSMQA